MKLKKLLTAGISLLFVAGTIAGCVANAPAGTSTEAATPGSILSIFSPATATLAPTPTPTATAIPKVPVGLGTQVPEPAAAITVDNVQQIKELACWGRAPIRKLLFSRATNQLVAVDTCGTVTLYDPDTLKVNMTLQSGGQTTGMELSPDGATLITANKEGKFSFIDLSSGATTRTMTGPAHDAFSVTYTNDTWLFTILDENGFKFYAPANNVLTEYSDINTWDAENARISAFSYKSTMDQDLFSSGDVAPTFSADGKSLLFNRFGRMTVYQLPFFQYVDEIYSYFGSNATFSADAKSVFVLARKDNWREKVIQRWDRFSKTLVDIYTFDECGGWQTPCNMRFISSADGRSLFILHRQIKPEVGEYLVSQLDLATNTVVKEIAMAAILPDGAAITLDNLLEVPTKSALYVSSDLGNLYKIDITEGKLLSTSVGDGLENDISYFLNKMPALLGGRTSTNMLILRNLPDGSIINKIQLPEAAYGGNVYQNTVLTFTVVNGVDGNPGHSTVTGYDLHSGAVLFNLDFPDQAMYLNGMSPDGSKVVLMNYADTEASLWSVKDGTKLLDLDPFQSGYQFSPDGKWMVSTLAKPYINLWNAETGKFRAKMVYAPEDLSRGYTFYWSADSTRLVSINNLGFKVWDVAAGTALMSITYGGSQYAMGKYGITSEMGPNSAALSADGALAAIYDGGGSIFLFDYMNNKLVRQFVIPGPMTSGELLFSQDGKYLYITSNGGRVVRVWGLHDDLSAAAETALSNNWTGGSDVAIDLVANPIADPSNPVADSVKLLAPGVNVSQPGKICHSYRRDETKWVGSIKQLKDGAWLDLVTSNDLLPKSDGTFMACAEAASAGTYALFGYTSPALRVQDSSCAYDTSNWSVLFGWQVGDSGFEPYLWALAENLPLGALVQLQVISAEGKIGGMNADSGVQEFIPEIKITAAKFLATPRNTTGWTSAKVGLSYSGCYREVTVNNAYVAP